MASQLKHTDDGYMKTAEKDLSFSIAGEDLLLLKEFKKVHKNCPSGMAGDKYSYNFCPTGLGTAITVECSCGKQLQLGSFLDYDSNPQKQKQDLSVFTYKQAQDDSRHKIIEHILHFKDPRIRRFFYSGEGSRFEQLMSYLHGIAFAAIDERTTKQIWNAETELFKECGGDVADHSASMSSVILSKLTDNEAIERYLEIFEERDPETVNDPIHS